MIVFWYTCHNLLVHNGLWSDQKPVAWHLILADPNISYPVLQVYVTTLL